MDRKISKEKLYLLLLKDSKSTALAGNWMFFLAEEVFRHTRGKKSECTKNTSLTHNPHICEAHQDPTTSPLHILKIQYVAYSHS